MVRGEPILTEVMDTIANLKDTKGSPPDKILDRLVSQRKMPLRNASLQVKKALKTGLKTGLLKEIGGKFKLGLGVKDYAIFKNFRQFERGGFPVKELRSRRSRRRRSRSRRRRRPRRRRRSNFFSLGLGDEESGDDYDVFKNLKKIKNTGAFPVKEVRRRRRSRSRRRRRGRRGRRRRRTDYFDLENLGEGGTDESEGGEPMDRSRRRRRRSGSRRRRRRGRRRGLGPEDEGDSVRSSESKEIISKSSEEKPKTAKGQGRGDTGGSRPDTEKRDVVSEPPRSRIDQESMRSSHCIHDHPYHHDGPYGHHPPPHYGGEHYYE